MISPIDRNGFYALAPGKLGVLTIYFERMAPFPETNISWPEPFRVEKLGPSDVDRYRALFKAVGGPWLWVSRLKISDEALIAILSHPKIDAFALTDGKEDIGFLELDHRDDGRRRRDSLFRSCASRDEQRIRPTINGLCIQ